MHTQVENTKNRFQSLEFRGYKNLSPEKIAQAKAEQALKTSYQAKMNKMTLADGHFHATNYVQQGPSLQCLLDIMDLVGLKYTVLSPIPTNQVACCNEDVYDPAHAIPSTAPNYYIARNVNEPPRSENTVTPEEYSELVDGSKLYVHTGVDADTAARYLQLKELERQRFDPMITGLALGDARSSEYLLRKLYHAPGVFTGVGEITVHKEWVQDKLDPHVQASVLTHIEPLKELMHTCGVIGMPVVLHCDVDAMPFNRTPGKEPLYLDGILNLLTDEKCRKTNIIWAHAGGLGKYSRISNGHLERIAKVLEDVRCKDHVYLDISWDTVAKQLTMDDTEQTIDNQKIDALAKFLTVFQDRVVYGSDSLSPNCEAHWQATVKLYEAVFKQMDPKVVAKIKLGNYERLLVAARPRVRAYEKHCLAHAMSTVDMRQDNLLPADVKAALKALANEGVRYGEACIGHELDGGPLPNKAQYNLVPAADIAAITLQVLKNDGKGPGDIHYGNFKTKDNLLAIANKKK